MYTLSCDQWWHAIWCPRACALGSMMRNGDIELQSRVEEIRFLEMEVRWYPFIIGCSRALGYSLRPLSWFPSAWPTNTQPFRCFISLFIQVADLRRSIDLLRGNLPAKRGLDNELSTLQIQLAQCHEYMRGLEHQLEDPTNADRMRLLSGSDPSMNDLHVKVEQVSPDSEIPGSIDVNYFNLCKQSILLCLQ